MKQKKLIWQIFPANLIIVFSAILAVSWYGSSALHEFYIQESIIDLEARARLIKSNVADYLKAEKSQELRDFSMVAGRDSHTRITVIDVKGVVLADSNEEPESMDNHQTRPEIVAAYTGEIGSAIRHSATLGETMLYVAVPVFQSGQFIENASGKLLGKTVLRVSVPLNAIDKTLAAIRGKIVFGSLVVVFFAGVITLLVSRNVSKPLEEMKRNAESFAKGDFSQRMITTQRKSASLEIATLGTAMDNMAALLDEKIQAIETHRNQLETVFTSMVESVIAVDRNERVISVNKAAAKLLGVDQKQAQGKIVQEIVRNVSLQQQISHILSTEESLEDEIILQDETGDRYLQTSVVTLSNGSNEGVGVLVVMNDVTKLRRLESIRRDFVANVSHELRTPITSIRGYVETLLDGALDSREDSERFLKIVLKQSGRLSAIIDDLLSLSRIEQESKEGEIGKVKGPLCMVLDSAVQTCQLKADQEDVSIDLMCADNLQLTMNETLLEQAMVNLIVNAIKYSNHGGKVTIQADIVSEGASGDEVRIDVVDQGIGIASEHLPRLFERFYRSDKARSRELGGNGLGLAIVKHIVQAHEGRVEVASKEGEGTTFSLFLPV